MIETVTVERSTYAPPPARFEAGTPMIAEVIGLGAALEYIEGVGRAAIGSWEEDLLGYATDRVRELDGVRLIGTAREKAAVLSFVVEGVHPHDVGAVLDDEGIAIRAGHHCAQPLMRRLGLSATARASFSFYNTRDEVDALVCGLQRVQAVFA
jgi:cysteine desulfurase/selenocysteine lyase